LDGFKEASGIVEPIKTKDVAVWQLQERQELDKMKSTPKVAGVGRFRGFEGSIRQLQGSKKRKDLACHSWQLQAPVWRV